MGTVMSHKVFGKSAEPCLAAIRKEAECIEAELSRFLQGSDISRINQSAGAQCVPVSRNTCDVLSQAVEFSRQCQGCFDVTIGPLVTLWNSSKDTAYPPDESKIKDTLPLINFTDLVLDFNQRTAGLKRRGQSIDLGGIGKGFAGDRFLEIYREFGITSAYSNIGGNVVTVGTKPDGSPWVIGIQHPRQENQLIGSISVAGKTVVTSGDYQRYFKDSRGIRYHHILDPLTGYPSESGLISVSIVTEKSLAADALSTILFIAGMKKGLEILKNCSGTEAIFVHKDLRVFITPGLKNCFQPNENIDVTLINEMN